MKKFLLSAIALFIAAFSFAQVEVGIKFAPNISVNRLIDDTDTSWSVANQGVGLRFSAGPVVDIFMGDNMAVTTGVFFTTKKSSIQIDSVFTGSDYSVINPEYSLQYLQIPIGIKYFTNEITSGMKIYVEMGGTIEAKIAENIIKEDDTKQAIESTFANLIDAGLLVELGIEKDIGSSNKLFAGFTYNRGLLNVVSKKFYEEIGDEEISKDNIKYNNDLFSLVIGFKF